MALELKQSLKLSQQLVMTPQLQQAIKLLQLSRVELVDLVNKEMLENPILEEGAEAGSAEEGDTAEAGVQTEEAAGESASQNRDGEGPVKEVEPEKKDFDHFEWENYIGGGDFARHSLPSTFETPDELPTIDVTLSKQITLHDHLRSRQCTGQTFPGNRIDAQRRRCRDDFVTSQTQQVYQFRADQTCAT